MITNVITNNVITDGWHNAQENVTDIVSNAGSALNNSISSKLSELKLPETGGSAWGSNFDPSVLNIREKLKVECPEFLKQAGIMKVDFGSMFLTTPQSEEMFMQAQNIVTDAATTVVGASQLVTPEAMNSVIDALTFIITDIVNVVIEYSTGLFKQYISPEFAVQLALDLGTQTLAYTTKNTKNPADILKEITEDVSEQIENDESGEEEKARTTFIADTQEKFANVMTKVKTMMDEIQPYSTEIARYMQYGPEYAMTEVEGIYNKYLLMGISFVDEEIGKLIEELNLFISYQAETAGLAAAEKLNNIQRESLLVVKRQADCDLAKIKVFALGLIHKVQLQLLAVLGG